MNELRDVIAKNICDLRSSKSMTQQNLAEVLNYSDKAVSKWERGESIPDVLVLKQIADFFEVSVDYLLSEEHEEKAPVSKNLSRKRSVISALSASLVWFIATVFFVGFTFVDVGRFSSWLVFIYAIPASSVVLLVFNSLWGKRRLNYIIISIIAVSLILSIYLTLLAVFSYNLWYIFLVLAPSEVIIILWSGLGAKKKLKCEGK